MVTMDTYMERHLIRLHDVASASQMKEKLVLFVIALLLIFLIPVVHLGVIYSMWASRKPHVNEEKCNCDCFDTIFKGPYEWPPTSYKHVYFNSTANTAKIWLLTCFGILSLYEVTKYLVSLIWHRKLRNAMFALFISSIYPHYYGWWGFFNYLNEDFYSQWWHQVFFSLTEVISTILVIHLCNRENKMEPWKLLVIADINSMHILINCLDQFVHNVFFHGGQDFEVARDVGLLVPDVFHVLVCYFELRILADSKNIRLWNLFYKEELMMSAVLVTLFSLLGKNL